MFSWLNTVWYTTVNSKLGTSDDVKWRKQRQKGNISQKWKCRDGLSQGSSEERASVSSVLHCRPFHRKSLPYMAVTDYCVCSYMLLLCYVSMATKTSQSDSIWLTLITFLPKVFKPSASRTFSFYPSCFSPPSLFTLPHLFLHSLTQNIWTAGGFSFWNAARMCLCMLLCFNSRWNDFLLGSFCMLHHPLNHP